jgi:hypothetical protein
LAVGAIANDGKAESDAFRLEYGTGFEQQIGALIAYEAASK